MYGVTFDHGGENIRTAAVPARGKSQALPVRRKRIWEFSALGETLRCFARTLPDVGQWTMAELCAKWRESEGGEERIDPEAERVRGPATPLVDANGDTFDGGADF